MPRTQEEDARYGRIGIAVGFGSALGVVAFWALHSWLQENYEPPDLHSPYFVTMLARTVAFVLLGVAVLAFPGGLVLLRARKTLVVVVVASLVLLNEYAWPRFPHDSRLVRESSAVANLRTINTAQVTYLSTSSGRFGAIPDLVAEGLLDASFLDEKNSYRFHVNVAPDGMEYTAAAQPVEPARARYGYYTTSEFSIHYALTRSETCNPCFPRYKSGQPLE